MSDLQTSNNFDLTAYNVDGLELFFTPSRKVRASQSAIARMCGVSEATIRNRCSEPIVKNDSKCDVIQAQTSSTGGGKRSKLHNSHTISILLKEFNPERREQFLEFGIDEGLAQMAGVPVATVTPVVGGYQMPDNVTILEMALQLAKEDRNRQSFMSDKPGLKAIDDLAKSDKGLTLAAGKFIVKELANEYGLELDRAQSSGLSAMLTLAVMTQNLERPTKRLVPGGKRKQGYYVNEYSYDVKSVAVDCMKHMQLI
jgi:hypothetical protein